MEHREASELLEAYVIGALDPEELTGVQQHLDAGCPECEKSLNELRELCSHLALAVPQTDPVHEIQGKLMSNVAGSQPDIKAFPAHKARTVSGRGWLTAGIAAVLALYFGIRIVSLKQEVRERDSRLTVASDKIVRLDGSLQIAEAENDRSKDALEKVKRENSRFREALTHKDKLIADLQREIVNANTEIATLQKSLTETEDITELIGSPGTQFVNLSGVDPNPQAFGKVVIDPLQGSAVVYMYRLPEPPECMEYQLWVIREGKPTSAGVFKVGKDGHTVLKLRDLPDPESIASFTVTIEPSGGKPEPTGMMYLIGP